MSEMTCDADPGGGPVKILLVDDHRGTRSAVLALLCQAFPQHHLLGADSAESALSMVTTHPPAMVIMDIALPGMNGVDATRRIKALSPRTHVVMLSNSDMQVYQDSSLAAGASAFVSKRRSSSELVPVVSALLAPAYPAVRPIL
jgi:DNA-binding NarL/FixJ family response regulator